MKHNPVFHLIFSILFLCILCISCQTVPRSSSESWHTNQRFRKNSGNIVLLGVSVYRTGARDSIQSEIRGLAPLLFWDHRLRFVTDPENAAYAADIRVHEREYMKKWKTKRSLAIELRIWAVPPGMPAEEVISLDEQLPLAAGRIIYAGNKSFSSSKTTGLLLSMVMNKTVSRLRTAAHGGKSYHENYE